MALTTWTAKSRNSWKWNKVAVILAEITITRMALGGLEIKASISKDEITDLVGHQYYASQPNLERAIRKALKDVLEK